MTKDDFVLVAEKHFLTQILPLIKDVSIEAADNMLVFVEGSVAYGFCDQKSDVDIDYFIDVPISDEKRKKITSIFNADDYLMDDVHVSYGFGGDYWKIAHIINNDMDSFWREFNPYAVNNLVQAIAIWDPKKLLPMIQERVKDYPKDVKKRVVRGLWITVNDSGEYNFKDAIDRNRVIEGKIYLYRAIEAMMRLVYVLNDRYYPPTKWLSRGLSSLDNDFDVHLMLEEINEQANLMDAYASFMKVYENMKNYMLGDGTIEKECIEDYPNIFSKPFHIFNTF